MQARPPAVAGRFYPGTAAAVDRALEDLLPCDATSGPVHAVIAPHAGWIYSGAIAGATWAVAEVPRHVVLLCPNHTGHGPRRALWPGGAWSLPSGEVPVDDELVDVLAEHCGLERDRSAHLQEHAIEVHLPFLQARRPDVRIAAICLGGLSLAECRQLGEELATAARAFARPILWAASTDMSHYVPVDVAAELDARAIDRILALDPEGLHDTVRNHRISMCGVLPVAVTLFATAQAPGRRADLVRYGHSGERSGDLDRVVGYAGLVVR